MSERYISQPDQRTATSHTNRGPLLLRYLGPVSLAATALFMGACRSESNTTANTGSAMAPTTARADQPTVWNDPDLPNHPDRGLTSLMLRFDSQYNPAGSVRMETCYDKPGKFRVASREKSPRPGPGPDYYLVDKTFAHEAGCYPNVWPVSPIDVGDDEIVDLGIGDTDEDLSKVREYAVKRTGTQTLEVKPLGSQQIGKPGTLKMRDAQKTP